MEQWFLLLSFAIVVLGFIVSGCLIFFGDRKIKDVVLLGLTGCGKTRLFHHLVTKRYLATFTSQIRNESSLQVGEKQVNLIDLPGQPPLRPEARECLKMVNAIIFVIDAATFLSDFSGAIRGLRNYTVIANLLYDILSVREVIARKIPVLIVASKIDMAGDCTIGSIRTSLQLEFASVRENRRKSSEIQNDESYLFLGIGGKNFNFDDLRNEVKFASCSAQAGSVQEVYQFLEEVAPK
jgi:small GTP-binding protein